MQLLRTRQNDDEAKQEAVRCLQEASGLVGIVRRRRFTAAVVEALLAASKLGLSLHEIYVDSSSPSSRSADAATPAATADVLASKDEGEACPSVHDHEMHEFFQRIHAVNPYEEFDAAGLEYTAGEHQGHDQSMMAALIHAISPRLIIEVGSWKGGSAIQMASVVRRRGWGCSTKILCVDTWLGTSTDLKANRRALKNGYPTVYYEFVHNIMSAGLSSVVVPLPAPANIAAKFLGYLLDKDEMPAADLIFIDGNHDYDDVVSDITNYFPFLSPGGIMFGDDFGWAGVKKAVQEFAHKHNLTVLSPGGRTWMIA
jgi:predicted O-methyltransferase YrrM